VDPIIKWLLQGDVSIQYLTKKCLLNDDGSELHNLRKRIATEGWGKGFLAARNASGHWGRGFYQPKWISSHYTLLDLRYLEIEPVEPIIETIGLILAQSTAPNGSINESRSIPSGDVCVNGMFLNYAAFFGTPEEQLKSIVDYLLDNIIPDGGFNCEAKPEVQHTVPCIPPCLRWKAYGNTLKRVVYTGLMNCIRQNALLKNFC
jgi:hypothetical protein